MFKSKDNLSRLGKGQRILSQISSFGQIEPTVVSVLVRNNWIQYRLPVYG